MDRGHWSILEIYRRIKMLASDWKVERAIIEDTSSGMGLIQMFRQNSNLVVRRQRLDADKQTRMERHEARLEAGDFFLPKAAPWLRDFEDELLTFPNGRHDDQVDAVLLFLDWFANWRRYNSPTRCETGLPISG
jgi:predicted phage terminase large subunit-like protein